MNQSFTLKFSPAGWHSLCVDQGCAQGVFQAAAVHHAGQPSHPQLPREKQRRTSRSQRGQSNVKQVCLRVGLLSDSGMNEDLALIFEPCYQEKGVRFHLSELYALVDSQNL